MIQLAVDCLQCFNEFVGFCLVFIYQEKRMVVFVEHSVLDDPCLSNHPGFNMTRDKLMSFREGKDDLTDKIDFIICLGGDGTLLYASSLFQVITVQLLCNRFEHRSNLIAWFCFLVFILLCGRLLFVFVHLYLYIYICIYIILFIYDLCLEILFL